jgi:hypothetical protein
VVEFAWVSEGLMREMMRFGVMPDAFDVVQFGCVFGQPLDDEPVGAGGQRCQRELWIGPLSSTSTTGLMGCPGFGPYSRSSCSRWATKSLLRLVGLVCTISWRVTWSNEPSMATFFACPGAGTRRSAPALAHARAR